MTQRNGERMKKQRQEPRASSAWCRTAALKPLWCFKAFDIPDSDISVVCDARVHSKSEQELVVSEHWNLTKPPENHGRSVAQLGYHLVAALQDGIC